MGNQLAGGASSLTDLSSLLTDVPGLAHGATLGLGKILKTAWCEHDDGRVIVKLYPKREQRSGGSSSVTASQSNSALSAAAAAGSLSSSAASTVSSPSTIDPELRVYEKRLDDTRKTFTAASAPNLLPFARWIDGERAVFLVRQYFAYNVYDRLHTHPFLTQLEKKWLAYQLLEALRQLHNGNIRHGDIKTENLLCTTWNWLLLTDVAFFKPTFLPADNPADYAFYFETTRRRCYLAPERFYTAGEKEKTLQAAYLHSQQQQQHSGMHTSHSTHSLSSAAQSPAASNFDPLTVTEAMDVFSAGCCIAELFMNGEPLFDLPQLLSYREGVYDPLPTLQAKVQDPDIRDLILHMTQINPQARFSAKGYIREWKERSFPSSFEYLHKLFARLLLSPEQLSQPDQKLMFIKQNERNIIREIARVDLPVAATAVGATVATSSSGKQQKERDKRAAAGGGSGSSGEQQGKASQHVAVRGWDERKEKSSADSNGVMQQQLATTAAGGIGASLAAASSARTSAASASFQPLIDDITSFAATLEKHTAAGQLKEWSELQTEAKSYRKAHFATASLPPPALHITAPANSHSASASSTSASHSPTSSPQPWNASSAPNSSSVPRTHYSPDSPQRRLPASTSSSLTVRSSLTSSNSTQFRPSDDNNSEAGILNVAALADDGTTALSNGARTSSVTVSSNVLTMVATLVCSCVLNVQSPKMKLVGLDLMLRLGEYVEDEVRLGRLVPYCVALLADTAPSVRAMAVATLTAILSLVSSFPQSDAHIFPEYVFPALSRFPHDQEELVRLAYAARIAQLADNSRRFLDIAQQNQQSNGYSNNTSSHSNSSNTLAVPKASSGGGLTPSPSLDQPLSLLVSPPSSPAPSEPSVASSSQSSYESELGALQDLVLRLVIDMLTVGGSCVKRCLLVDIARLCMFIGRKRVNNELLPHLITVLNDRDWQLRVCFFDHIVGVSAFVGRIAFTNYVLPCVEQALFDVEESVIQRAVHALTQLCHLGLFDKRVMLDIVEKAGPLLCHPSAWIREECIAFVLAMADTLGLANTHCFLLPALQPFITQPIAQFSRSTLLPVLKPPLTRHEFAGIIYPNMKHTSTGSGSGSNNPSSSAPPPFSASLPDSLLQTGSYLGSSNSLPSDGADAVSSTHSHSSQEDADRLRTASSGSNASTLSTHSSAASTPSPFAAPTVEPPVSGWQQDATLKTAMLRYLNRVANAVASKGYTQPADGVSALSLDEELDSYLSIDDEAPVFQVEVERTVSDPTASVTAAAGDRVQQDLLDSLGMQVQRQGGTNPSAVRSEQQRQAADYLQQKSSQAGADGSRRREPIRQPLNKVPPYILKALKVPPAPPSLGQLRESTISTSAFYRNHHQLEASTEQHDPKQWRPRGVLVATLSEHSASVNSLAVSRDNVFLVSGSDDGTVKVWDCARLKLTANARSQLTHQQPGRVTAVAMIDSSHSIVAASDVGLLEVMKVEYAPAAEESGGSSASGGSNNSSNSNSSSATGHSKYGGWSEVRKIDARAEGSVLCVEHFNTVTESLLLYATQKGTVHTWDLRSRREPFTLHIEPAMGLLSALVIGPTPYVLIAGTSRGFVLVWDLRFQLPIQVWRHHQRSRIVSLTPQDLPSILPKDAQGRWQHPTKGPLVFVAAEGNHQLAAFDLLTGECRMCVRVQPATATSGATSASAGALSAPTAVSATVASQAAPMPGQHGKAASAGQSALLSSGAALSTTADGQLRHKVHVSPLSLPSLRSYLRHDYPASLMDESFLGELTQLADSITQQTTGAVNNNSSTQHSTYRAQAAAASTAQPPSSQSITSLLCCPGSFCLTAGTDRVVRFWDLHEPLDSYRVTGPPLLDDNWQPRYSGRIENSSVVMEETLQHSSNTDSHSGTAAGEQQQLMKLAVARKSRGATPPASCHQSEIVDMKAIEWPQKMIATASTDGMIKVWI